MIHRYLRRMGRTPSAISTFADIAVIIGIAVAGIAYFADRAEARVDASLSYLNRFSTGEILNARNIVYDFWRNQDRNVLSSMGRDRFHRYVTLAVTQNDAAAHEIPIVNIIGFFDGMQTCIAVGICDAGILQAELKDYAQNLSCNYAGFIQSQRDPQTGGLSNFGVGLEDFAGPTSDCTASE